MKTKVKYQTGRMIANGASRLLGNLVKTMSYPFHWLFPAKRFTIPEYSPAKFKSPRQRITPVIWQTNYTNQVTLPIYCNYLFNRLLSLSYDYRYVSTEARAAYLQQHADERTFNAYAKLTDGASQADFWRIFTLYQEGGVYLDIDGHLVWNLASMIGENDDEVLITRRGKYTNFFMASAKNNAFLHDTLAIIIENIEQRKIDGGVFSLTGPTTLNQALENKTVNACRDKLVAAQGTFTNEHFQYIDKKNSKWNYKKNEDLLK